MVFLLTVLTVAASAVGDKGVAPPLDRMAQVREILGKLEGVESIHAVKLRDGSFQVRMIRKQGTDVPLIWRDGMQQASYTYWGSDLSFVLRRTQRGIMLDCLQGVSTPVSGPFRTRDTYVRRLELELDGGGRPYVRSTSQFWGPLGRERWRSTILTACNLPNGGLLQLIPNQDAMDKLRDQISKLEGFGEIKIARSNDGKLDVTVNGNPRNKIEVNRQMGLQTVETIELGKNLSFRVSDDGKNIKFENIQNVKVNVSVFGSKLSVDLKSVVLSKEKNGTVSAKAEVTNPLAKDKTMIVPVDLKNLLGDKAP